MTDFFQRRYIRKDNGCLFSAILYLVKGPAKNSFDALQSNSALRKKCSEFYAKDPERFNSVMIGMDHEQYLGWICNPNNWGGETEIVALSEIYEVDISVVSMPSMQVLTYFSPSVENKNRIYILYTGQHYDVLVGGKFTDLDNVDEEPINLPIAKEKRTFKVNKENNTNENDENEKDLEKIALIAAQKEKIKDEIERTQRKVMKIKCGGCGSVVDDSLAFQKHCEEVEHDDEFCYDCEEVEVILDENEKLESEKKWDLESENSFCFYNTPTNQLGTHYKANINLKDDNNQKGFLSLDDYMSNFNNNTTNVSKEENKQEYVIRGMKNLIENHIEIKDFLISTKEKTLILLDSDGWCGCSYTIQNTLQGQNNIGQCWMKVRAEL